jgi:hypothetical protein
MRCSNKQPACNENMLLASGQPDLVPSASHHDLSVAVSQRVAAAAAAPTAAACLSWVVYRRHHLLQVAGSVSNERANHSW